MAEIALGQAIHFLKVFHRHYFERNDLFYVGVGTPCNHILDANENLEADVRKQNVLQLLFFLSYELTIVWSM